MQEDFTWGDRMDRSIVIIAKLLANEFVRPFLGLRVSALGVNSWNDKRHLGYVGSSEG